MKTIQKKQPKDCPLTIHVTTTENKYLRTRKRQTGLSISDVIREEWLRDTAELFFGERKKTSRNGQPAARSAPPVQ